MYLTWTENSTGKGINLVMKGGRERCCRNMSIIKERE